MRVDSGPPETERRTQRYTPDEAFAFCAELTNRHYENFPVASLFLPGDKRPYIQAIYAFSRVADDFADEGVRPATNRLRDLENWDRMLTECFEGHSTHPVFIALEETVRKNSIPVELLRNLLEAFKRDVRQTRYRTFDDVLSYCSCSANPVGRLVLWIFGYRDEKLFLMSDKICTALQLTNFWQDVRVDLQKDRCYIPVEEMERFGYSLQQWSNQVVDDSFRNLMKFQVERTRSMFYEGAQLPSLVGEELRLELKLVWFGGMSILKQLTRSRYDVFQRRPVLGFPQKSMVLARGLFTNDLSRFGKRKKSWDLT